MTRLLHIALLALTSTSVLATSSPQRAPWCIPRGGADTSSAESMATSIPVGGSDSSYAGQLEAVKSSVLDAASASVRFGWSFHSLLGRVDLCGI
jgi:hypothetical protein